MLVVNTNIKTLSAWNDYAVMNNSNFQELPSAQELCYLFVMLPATVC